VHVSRARVGLRAAQTSGVASELGLRTRFIRGRGLTQVIVSGRHQVWEKLGHDSWAGSKLRWWAVLGQDVLHAR
jgi:hypothetical protein